MAILQKKCSPRPIPAAKRRSLGEGSKAKQIEGRRLVILATLLILLHCQEIQIAWVLQKLGKVFEQSMKTRLT